MTKVVKCSYLTDSEKNEDRRKEKLTMEHVINLCDPCNLPFPGTVIEVHRGSGLVKLEKIGDDLFLAGQKIGPFLTEEQKKSAVDGYQLRSKLESRGGNVSAKVLDYLERHPELWPENCKQDENGNKIYLFFWDDFFRDPANGYLYVRGGYWYDGQVISGYEWLSDVWGCLRPAASTPVDSVAS